MCIRDRALTLIGFTAGAYIATFLDRTLLYMSGQTAVTLTCLLYTSDAADERSSVDLGGRRIIKKKKTEK